VLRSSTKIARVLNVIGSMRYDDRPVITERELLRHEVERVWEIDRSEVIDRVYSLENGALVPRPQHFADPHFCTLLFHHRAHQ
jgi:hypothetical protein